MRFLYRSSEILLRARSSYSSSRMIFRASLFGGPVPLATPFQVAFLSTVGSPSDGTELVSVGLIGEGGLPVASEGEGEDEETRFLRAKDGDRGPGHGERRNVFDHEGGGGEPEEGSDLEESGGSFAEISKGRSIVEGGGMALKRVLADSLNDEPYRGSLRTVLVGRRGASSKVFSPRMKLSTPHTQTLPDLSLAASLPLEEVFLRPSTPARSSAPGGLKASKTSEEKSSTISNAVLTRRAMRALYEQPELEKAAAAYLAQFGGDLEGFPLSPGHDRFDPLLARRSTDFKPEEDPMTSGSLPFDPKAVTVMSNMSWNASPGALNIDAKVTLTARVKNLGLKREVLPYLRLISGPRYSKNTDTVRISAQVHKSATANKREVLERLAALISQAATLEQKHGRCRGVPVLPKYNPLST